MKIFSAKTFFSKLKFFQQKQHSSDHRIMEVGKTSGDIYSKLILNTCLKKYWKQSTWHHTFTVKILALLKTQLQKYILRGAGLQLKACSAAQHQGQEYLHQQHSQGLMGKVTPQGKGAGEKKKEEPRAQHNSVCFSLKLQRKGNYSS